MERANDERPDTPVVATTPTFIPPEAIEMPGYTLLASPTLYPGQQVRARLTAHPGNAGPVETRLQINIYGEGYALQTLAGSPEELAPGRAAILTWRIPDLVGAPAISIG